MDSRVDDAARAILDGTPVDWTALDPSDDADARSLVAQLRILSTLADVHRAHARQWGHLQILEPVGAGAFGAVYRAWDTRLAREVALKLQPASPRDGASPIIQEGRHLARVTHPNVATIYGAEMHDGQVGLWMEYVRGRTLEELLQSGHQFTLADVLQIGIDLCAALGAVHDAGLLHGDIKAQNVMRTDEGRLVLMDFGTGRELADPRPERAGSPLYVAPEVFRGEPPTERSDLYSAGVLLFRLLTGGFPVAAATVEELGQVHAMGGRPDLAGLRPDLDPAVARVINRVLDPDPSRRFPATREFRESLVALGRRRSRRRVLWLLATAACVAGLGALGGLAFGSSKRVSIAVLPFENRTGNADNDLVVDGLTYEVIHELAVINGLDVRSAGTSFALKGRSRDLAEIGRRLDVSMVLEGTVMQSDGQWRVHAQLVRVDADTPLWSNRFDRPVQAAFAVQDDISRAVVSQLRLTIGGGQRRYDLDPEISTMYLRARALAERRGSPSAVAAVAMFKDIIARDPEFAPAYAGLADAYSFFSQDLPDVGGLPPDIALRLMRPAAEKALDLDPLLAEAHAALAMLHARENRWPDAVAGFRKAIELNPALTHVRTDYSMTTLLPLGRFDEIEELLVEARRRDPLSAAVYRELGAGYLNAGRYDEAVRELDRAGALDAALPYVDILRARALSLAGRLDEAMPFWESQKQSIGYQHWMAYAFVHAGRRADVEAMLPGQKNAYRLAMIHTALGNLDEAFDYLDRAATEAPHRVVRLLAYPEMAPLRGDPRFAAIRARFRLQ